MKTLKFLILRYFFAPTPHSTISMRKKRKIVWFYFVRVCVCVISNNSYILVFWFICEWIFVCLRIHQTNLSKRDEIQSFLFLFHTNSRICLCRRCAFLNLISRFWNFTHTKENDEERKKDRESQRTTTKTKPNQNRMENDGKIFFFQFKSCAMFVVTRVTPFLLTTIFI